MLAFPFVPTSILPCETARGVMLAVTAVTNGEKISLSSFMDYFELNLLVCVRQNLMSKLRNWLSVLCTASVS